MPRFRKKPVEVEAVFFNGSNWSEIQLFTGFHKSSSGEFDIQSFNPAGTYHRFADPHIVAEVWDKLHSTWVGVKRGQWIIQGLAGEFYPCDASVFANSYERLDHAK